MDTIRPDFFENEYITGSLTDGVMVCHYKSHVREIDAATACQCIELRLRFAAGRTFPYLMVANQAAQMTPAAMNLNSSPQAQRQISALGIIVHSPLQKFVGNLYLKYLYRRFDIPVRLYQDERAAMAWLQSYAGLPV